MIHGVGIDICSVSRIAKAIESRHFRERVFTHDEIVYAESKGSGRAQSYAACFAAREAFCKASGVKLMHVMNAKNFAVLHDSDGKPSIWLSESLEFLSGSKIFVSLTHEKDSACAIVIIER